MDRRTWLQLITILTAAREANAQQRGGATPPPADAAGRGGRGQGGQNLPMRITKDQVIGALKLMGLEFQDAELDLMLRGANQAISNYESLRAADVPIDTEPAFAFHPGLPDRQPIKGPQRFDTTIPKVPAAKGAVESGRRGVLARGRSRAAHQIARRLVHRPHEDVPGAHAEVLAQTALPDHLHRRTRAAAGGGSRPARSAPGTIAGRCTAFPSG